MFALRNLLVVGLASISFLGVQAAPTTSSKCVETNLIQNPSFEAARFSPWINFHGATAGSSGDVKAQESKRYFIANLVPVDNFISVRQPVTDLTIGQSYSLKFWYGLGTHQQLHQDVCSLSVTLNGEVVGDAIDLVPATAGHFQMAERIFTADTTIKTVRFEFNCGGSIGEVDALLDNVSLAARCS
ncbi:hypothetical protein PFICI_01130 [Pestalotiopsis fici W106-1]|uniref:CBM-cenC domain-containing protein n=1 Tax=Pestalotiopsis fici (strain W106-1 / CGMCC3.15140) TaxID=1229662 RepID=W3XP66_PESFW|nr:uncharacterized protein PFICI_01130 [Pestalotiopsis fici W106-1]ETS87302.1 hypothetical protein PFICI_01130 [Pestalotiopsis fici W106-1]